MASELSLRTPHAAVNTSSEMFIQTMPQHVLQIVILNSLFISFILNT